MINNKIQIKQFYFENGVSDGYYVVDAKGVNWAVQPTKQLALDWYNKLNETDIKIFELDMYDTNIQVSDVIGFYTCCNADRKRMIGLVEYKDQLGFITIIDGVQYELRKLIDIEVANENEMTIYEQRCNAIAEVKEYASEIDPIRFLDSPIPKNHLYCVRGKYCDYYQTTNMINVYVKYDLKKLNLETDLPYLARLSKSYDEFLEYWDKEADKLKRMASDVFYKFKNNCQKILDAMNAIDKKYFFNFHTND
jgi:hypothetical protein